MAVLMDQMEFLQKITMGELAREQALELGAVRLVRFTPEEVEAAGPDLEPAEDDAQVAQVAPEGVALVLLDMANGRLTMKVVFMRQRRGLLEEKIQEAEVAVELTEDILVRNFRLMEAPAVPV